MKMPLAPVYAKLETSFLMEVYARGPARLRTAVNELSLDDLKLRPRPEKWSILEIAVHLADAELVGAVRFRLAAAEDGPVFPAYDQDRWAVSMQYASSQISDLSDALDAFDAVRRSSLRLLRRLQENDWNRTGQHPERGPMTLRQLLELYADHSERHLEQIVALRKLMRRSIELPSLLPERLY